MIFDIMGNISGVLPLVFLADYIRADLGEVAERLKAQSWKDCMLQKGIEGSNPSLSDF